jgi:hypothetical protein
VEDDETDDEDFHPITPLVMSGGLDLLDSEKAEALADRLEAQF